MTAGIRADIWTQDLPSSNRSTVTFVNYEYEILTLKKSPNVYTDTATIHIILDEVMRF
jgi:hypothetical protein